MTLKLIPPGRRKNKFFTVYGWWNGRPFERSTGTADELLAIRAKALIEIELVDALLVECQLPRAVASNPFDRPPHPGRPTRDETT